MSDSNLLTHVTTVNGWTVLVMGDDLHHINETKIEEGRTALLRATDKALEEEPYKLLIDMAGCGFFGSSFIEALFQAWKKLDKVGGELSVCGCNKDIREVFEVTRLDNVWKIHDTREEAVA